ncbi:MAG: thioredoxin family protein [Sulfurimonas sp.]|nr:thioredoxin family protein [Sulfurimonas sp.]MDQ7060163.1 thioredoxin family protein [Sulfurimonas sp.]
MKSIFLVFILISSIHGYELNWLHDYDKALDLAQKENKDVYVFIGADDCRFCERFKDLTLSKKEVMQRLHKNFIPVYLSRDQHYVPPQFVTQGVPRHYFTSPKGDTILSDAGSREPAGFYDILDEVELLKD